MIRTIFKEIGPTQSRLTCSVGDAARGQTRQVERILNHAGGTFAGVAGVYNRFEYGQEMLAALGERELRLSNLIPQLDAS
jgi:hypothetical protein